MLLGVTSCEKDLDRLPITDINSASVYADFPIIKVYWQNVMPDLLSLDKKRR